MPRFERQEVSGDSLEDTVGAATEQLRATLEREAVEIISKAREQAAGIEQAARQSADEVVREARARADEEDARAQEARVSQSKRIAAVLEDVDDLERRMLATIADLRRRLSAETVDEPVADPEPADGDGAPPAPAATSELSVAAEVDAATERNPVLDDMMRAQLLNMAGGGTPRAEAERFLGRFKLGESYLDMLDEVYSEEDGAATPTAVQSKRRRLIRRST